MYIKRVIICGFKSYKKKVVLDLSPGHNVVVGSNGSGKSNIYAALEFVLSSKYDQLRPEQRKQLLHDAGQSGVVSAFVEIIFDNKDGRFPINESLISIKRAIGAKKDEYFVNQRHTTKTELNNLLESAGISKVNQHFIVPQGQIAQRVKERDNERLALIKEIAGTRVYDNKRGESLQLMGNADHKRAKVKLVIDYFAERLEDLKTEKEELAKFEKLDRKRKSVEFQIYDKDRRQTQHQLALIDEQGGQTDKKSEALHRQLKAVQTELEEATTERNTLKDNIETISRGLKRQRKELQTAEQALVTLEHKQRTLEKNSDEYNGKKAEFLAAQEALERKIKSHKEKLATITASFQAVKKREVEQREAVKRNEGAIQDLYAKQERLGQYRSKKQRNKELSRQVAEHQEEIDKENKLCRELTKATAEIDAKLAAYAKELRTIQKQQKASNKALTQGTATREQLKKRRAKLQSERKALWKQQSELEKEAHTAKQMRAQHENDFRFTMSLSMWKSYTALKKIQQDINEHGADSRYKLSGRLYGPVIENFDVVEEGKYNLAVEAAASNKLLYYLVENDTVGAEMIAIMQRERINRVTFIPLNRCGPDRQRDRNYPSSTDVIPLIRLLRFDESIPNMKGAFLQIFGNTLITPSVEIGSEYAKRENFESVTLGGDKVTSQGAVDGGFNENKYRRLKCYHAIRAATAECTRNAEEKRKTDARLQTVQQQLLGVDNELRGNEQATQQQRAELSKSKERWLELEEEVEIEEQAKIARAATLEAHEADKERLAATVAALEAEMTAPLKNKLSDAELKQIEELDEENEAMRKQLATSLQETAAAETEKLQIESVLRDKLVPQRKELLAQLKRCEQAQQGEQRVDSMRNRIAMEREQRDKRKVELRDNEKDIETWTKRLKSVEKEVEKLSAAQQKLVVDVESHSVDSQNLVGRRQALQEKVESLGKHIHALGALNQTEVAKYKNKGVDALKKTLDKLQGELKEYASVNKKALDQWNSFSKEKRKLESRNKEQMDDKEHIERLMQHLDLKKDDAILRTFHAINDEFKKAFKSLVVRGNAKLMMFENKEGVEGDAEEEDEDDEDLTQTQSSLSQSQRAGGRVRRRRRSSNMNRNRNRRKSSLHSQSQYALDEETDKKYAGVGIRVTFGRDADEEDDGKDEDVEEESDRARDMRQLSGGQQTVVALALIFAIQRCDPSPFYVFDEIDAALDQQYRKAVADLISAQKGKTQFITTTFRPEILNEADKAFIVDFKNKISTISDADPQEVDITQYI